MNDGKILRVPIPPLTEERRKELVRHLHKVLENHRTSIRNVRREANEALKKLFKDKTISEDELKRGQERLQKLTDQFVTQVAEIGKVKEREILEP